MQIHRIDHGWQPVISPNGNYISYGYEQLFIVDPRSHLTKACPHPTTHYNAGWWDDMHVAFMSDWGLYIWNILTNQIINISLPTQPIQLRCANNEFYLVDGNQNLWRGSSTGYGIIQTGVDGLVVGEPRGESYLYDNYPSYSKTIVRKHDGTLNNELIPKREWANSFSIKGQIWISSAFNGYEVVSPEGEIKNIPNEGTGPIIDKQLEILCFSVFWHEEKPYVMGRPWANLKETTPGYLLENFGHQGLTARPVDEGILVAGWKNDSTAEMQYSIFPYSEQRKLKPSIEPPVENPDMDLVAIKKMLDEMESRLNTRMLALADMINVVNTNVNELEALYKQERPLEIGIRYLGNQQGKLKEIE